MTTLNLKLEGWPKDHPGYNTNICFSEMLSKFSGRIFPSIELQCYMVFPVPGRIEVLIPGYSWGKDQTWEEKEFHLHGLERVEE